MMKINARIIFGLGYMIFMTTIVGYFANALLGKGILPQIDVVHIFDLMQFFVAFAVFLWGVIDNGRC